MCEIKQTSTYEFGDFRFPGGLRVDGTFIPDLFDTINFERVTMNLFDHFYYRFRDKEYKIGKGRGFYYLLIKVGSHDESWSWVRPTNGQMWAKLDREVFLIYRNNLMEELVDYHSVNDSKRTEVACNGVVRRSLDRALRGVNKKSSLDYYDVIPVVEKPVSWELGKGIGGEISWQD